MRNTYIVRTKDAVDDAVYIKAQTTDRNEARAALGRAWQDPEGSITELYVVNPRTMSVRLAGVERGAMEW